MSRLRALGRGGRLLVALAVGGALFGIATAVQADIPDSGVIHGCYKIYQGHALRVIDTSQGEHCLPGELPLDWNAAGVTGARGATGPTGPRGPSEGYQGNTVNDTTFAANGFGDIAGLTIANVPSGKYMYSLSTYITPIGGPTKAHCGPTGLDPGTDSSSGLGTTPVATPQWIPTVGQFRVNFNAGQGTVGVFCSEDGGVNGFLAHGALTLTRVTTINGS
jgi:hypothetical protein